MKKPLEFDQLQAITIQRHQEPQALYLMYKHPNPSTREIQHFESVAIFLPQMVGLQSEAKKMADFFFMECDTCDRHADTESRHGTKFLTNVAQ